MNRSIYVVVLVLMALSTIRLEETNYAIYLAPLILPIFWMLGDDVRFKLSPSVLPFLFLVCVGAILLDNYQFNTTKKLYFIFVYTSIFLLFDFSKIHIDTRLLALYFIALFLVDISYGLASGTSSISFDINESKSTFESTMAFPLGMLMLFFFLRKDYLWFTILLVLSFFAMKRIVLLSTFLIIVIDQLPEKHKRLLVNPYLITVVATIGVLLCIEFSRGSMDPLIQSLTGLPPNHFSQGRQELWSNLLNTVHFDHFNFLFLGAGFGASANAMELFYSSTKMPVHNDILSLVVDIGYLLTIVFIFLLNKLESMQERLLALFISLIFFTDNVLIYQHLMIPYLLLQSQLRRSDLLTQYVKTHVVMPKAQ